MASSKHKNYRHGNSVQGLFCKLPKPVIRKLAGEVNRLSPRYGLTYVDDDGKTTRITLTLRPRLISAGKRDAVWKIIRTLDGAFSKIASLYLQNPALRPLFPFSEAEKEWIQILREPSYRPGCIVSRWDANTTFGEEDWKRGWSFFEVNGVGVGGLWYGTACAEVALKTIVPRLKKLDSRFHPLLGEDMPRLLLKALLHQQKKLGRRQGRLALTMEKASGSNYVEFERFARYFTRLGYRSLVTEPTDFSLRNGEIYAKGKLIDIIYRDTTLPELCGMEEKGHSMEAFREALRRGQAISSLEGEFDHKSVFEVFTNPEYAFAFTPKEREIFRRHVLWTRLLTERRTTDPEGKRIDLIPFILQNQTRLVLKPNRLYGGKGVLFGKDLSRSAWEEKIESGLKESGDWVVQEIGELRSKRFCRPNERGLREKDLYVVSGFFATERGLGIVGRMSERTVVNVARQGGLTPILLTP